MEMGGDTESFTIVIKTRILVSIAVGLKFLGVKDKSVNY